MVEAELTRESTSHSEANSKLFQGKETAEQRNKNTHSSKQNTEAFHHPDPQMPLLLQQAYYGSRGASSISLGQLQHS